MNYLVAAIHKLNPTAEFVVKNDDFSTIEWIALNGNAPTKAQIDAAIKQIKDEESAAALVVQNLKMATLQKLGLSEAEVAALLS